MSRHQGHKKTMNCPIEGCKYTSRALVSFAKFMLQSCEMQMRKVVHGLPFDMRKFEEVASNALKLVNE